MLSVTGTDFEPGNTARLTGGSGLAASSRYVSSTTLELTVTVYDVATLGPWDLRVTNPDDGLGVCTGCFTVVPGPTLTGMDPAVAARGSVQQVTLSGSGFVTGRAS
ncbi:hypothetical protein BH18ACT7_BH18ACT7_18510 [soil metagenome]